MKRRTLKAFRRVTAERGATEKATRSARNAAKFALGKPITRQDVFATRGRAGDRFGVYAMGGCDVRTVVGSGAMLAKRHGGPLCVGSFGNAPESRSDLLLQTLDPPSADMTAEVAERLGLAPDYFAPRLFEPEFSVPDQIGLGTWPKDVVVLSISSDVSRTLYRHREHGFLVDPGGWWLASDLDEVLSDLSVAKWFGASFRKVRRITVEDSMSNFGRLVDEVRSRTGAFVVVLNVLTVDPGQVALDYKQSNSPHRVRRRRFCQAIIDLARSMEFPVLDVDRLTKQQGISGQADFVHYTGEQKRLICREFAGLLVDSGIVAGSNGAGHRLQPAG